jgi:AcrR family transcriptional regulator
MEKYMSKTATKPVRKVIQGPVAQAQILDAVDELFYKEGARAVGVDAVAKHAGVNKMCLYRQFESKDGLLLRYLERRDQRFWDYFEGSQAKHPHDPRRQLLQFFSDVTERTQQQGYRGCAFVNIATEFPDRDHPARQLVANNKIRLLAHLQDLAARAGAADAQTLAHGLGLLLEGAYTASQTYPAGHPILASLQQAAKTLLDADCAANHQPVHIAQNGAE